MKNISELDILKIPNQFDHQLEFCFLQKKLIMVGSIRTLSKVPLLKLLIEKVEEQSGRLNVSIKDINYKGELKRCSQLR